MENVRYSVYSTVPSGKEYGSCWAMNDRSSVPSSLGRTEISDDWPIELGNYLSPHLAPCVYQVLGLWLGGSLPRRRCHPGLIDIN